MEISTSITTIGSLSRPPFVPFSSSNSTFFCNEVRTLQTPPLVVSTRSRRTTQSRRFTCNALFGLGVPELVVIAGVAALVFGPKKLPEVGRSIGKTVKSFQQAAKEFETELKKDPDSPAEPSGEQTTAVSKDEKQDSKVPSSKESV